jgi:cysteine-rich repeat protein
VKREQFIFLIVLFALLVFYVEPYQTNLTYFGCTTSENPQNPEGNPSDNPISEESCYLSENPESVSGYKKIPAEFTYQGYKPEFEFEVRDSTNPNIYGPKIILGKLKSVPYSSIRQPESTSNCRYYTFFYQRKESSSTFNAPFSRFEQISPTQRLCKFSITPEMTSFIAEQTLGINLHTAKSTIPQEITAYEGTSEETDSNENSLKSEIIKTGQCPENSEQKSEFTDSQGNQFKLCIETESFNPGDEYITDSYIEEAGDYGCLKGGDYQKSGQEFVGSEGESYYLCTLTQSAQSQTDTIYETTISKVECPEGFLNLEEPIEINETTSLQHCIKRENPEPSINPRTAKIISSPGSGFISVCPELQGRDITDLDICKEGGTYPCEVTVSEGPNELYAYTYERDPCGNIIIKEDNEGLPLTGENYNERAQAFIAECTQRQEDAIPEEPALLCGNQEINEGEECDDGNTENGDGCSEECKFEKHLIIFVHGFGGSQESFDFYESVFDYEKEEYFPDAQIDYRYFEYDMTRPNNELAPELNEKIIEWYNEDFTSINIIAHSNGNLILYEAILLANGIHRYDHYETSAYNPDKQLSEIYQNTNIFSLNPVIGGSDYARFADLITHKEMFERYGEFVPASEYQEWLFHLENSNLYKDAVNEYFSADMFDDPHLGSVWDSFHFSTTPNTRDRNWKRLYLNGISSSEHFHFYLNENEEERYRIPFENRFVINQNEVFRIETPIAENKRHSSLLFYRPLAQSISCHFLNGDETISDCFSIYNIPQNEMEDQCPITNSRTLRSMIEFTPSTGLMGCSCETAIQNLKQQNPDSQTTIDFSGNVKTTWDLVQHNTIVDYFPDKEDVFLNVDVNVEDYDLEAEVPEQIKITIDIEGPKRDINWVLGKGKDEQTFITMRKEIIEILREEMPRIEQESPIPGFVSPIVADYFLDFQENIELKINSFDLPGTDDSIWVKNRIQFTFVQLSTIEDNEVIYTTLDRDRIEVNGERLRTWYAVYGEDAYENQGINTDNPFVIIVDETIDYYDYNNRNNLLDGGYKPLRSLYVPNVRVLGHERYIPVPWERIKQENPIDVLLKLESNPKLTEPFRKENGDAFPTMESNLQLVKDINECDK